MRPSDSGSDPLPDAAVLAFPARKRARTSEHKEHHRACATELHGLSVPGRSSVARLEISKAKPETRVPPILEWLFDLPGDMNFYYFIEFTCLGQDEKVGLTDKRTEWWTLVTLSRGFAARMYRDAALLLQDVLIPLAEEERLWRLPSQKRCNFLQCGRDFVFALHMACQMALDLEPSFQVESAFDRLLMLLRSIAVY